jgi:4-alpha-glucanotransferase
LISAPTKTYSGPHAAKNWGFFVPIYAVHSASSWGAGNLTDWRRFAEWVGKLGGRVVGSLPMLSAFLDSPFCEPAPYSPASRLFWNEFYLDITKIPEFETSQAAKRLFSSRAFQQKLKQFRHSNQIDYAEEMRIRRQVLECLSQSLSSRNSHRRQQFQAYLKKHPETERYARFRATCDGGHSSWRTWPERQRHGELRPGDYQEANCHYHAYCQWITEHQVEDLVQPGAQFRWYLDFPLGVHPEGYDLWREPDLFVDGIEIGAPPDPFFSRARIGVSRPCTH